MAYEVKPRLVVTTSWDDGSALDVKVAELLDRHGLQGTFYVPRGYLKHPLEKPDIGQLAARFEMGAHTLTHAVLTAIAPDRAREEIRGSKRYLEDIIGAEVRAFCYPKGAFNEAVADMVRESGFFGARTCRPGGFSQPSDRYRAPITMHLSNGSPRYVLQLGLRFGLGIHSLLNWEERAKSLFDRACSIGGVFHIWGHSWEIEQEGAWVKLDRVIQYVSGRENVEYACNSCAWGWPRIEVTQ